MRENLHSKVQGEPDFSGAKIDNRMLSDQVATFLFHELISGRLQPGHRINEAELARQLGISRNPIREAVRRLEERGLLVSAPRRGTFVRSFSRSDIDDIFSFRIVVEGFAIEQALPRMSDSDLDRVASFVDAMVAAADAGNEVALVENDLAFHLEICKLSANRQTLRAFVEIQAEVQMLITMAEQRFESLHAAAVDHWPVVEALRTRDIAKALDAIRFHINDSWRRLVVEFDRPDAPSGT
jgi:DNA-binding GntR family transcriptional regulator